MNLIDVLRMRATKIEEKLTEQRQIIDAPFLQKYPLDCCEIVSTHFGLTLQAEFPSSSIRIVRGYNCDKDEWHYWVELESIVLDLTAHQFDQYDEPLVGMTPSPLEDQFPDVERLTPCKAEEAANFPISHQILDCLR